VEALTGLAVETSLLSPFAIGYLIWLAAGRGGEFFGGATWRLDALLLLSGAIAAGPLLCFARAARALRLATLGLLLYIAPTGQFLLAVFAFGEPFTEAYKLAFVLIWTGLAVYSADAFARQRRLSREARAASVPNAPAETAAEPA
jgi:chloramphenicol-sensitive protein RarD